MVRAASNTVLVSSALPGAWYHRQAMSLVQLESFVAVAEEGHVGRAAARLHISQPPVTRRIRALEAELGVDLFTRTPRGMTLRPEGRRLLVDARDILARVQRAQRRLADPLDTLP